MDPANIIKALALADSLLTAAVAAYRKAQDVIAKAHAEGRDVTDAELDAITTERETTLAHFKSSVTGG